MLDKDGYSLFRWGASTNQCHKWILVAYHSLSLVVCKLCIYYIHMSSVQKCFKHIYQGVNLWCLCKRKIGGHESSRKSFAKEPQKTYAAKAPRKYTPPHNIFSAKVHDDQDVPATAKTVVAKAPRKLRENNSQLVNQI